MTARKLITIEGQQRPWTDGEWVFWNPDGFPEGCMLANPRSGDDPAKAAREFWDTNTEALKHLTAGWRVELMTRDRWRTEVMPIHLGRGRLVAKGGV